jgi:VanZ family protein
MPSLTAQWLAVLGSLVFVASTSNKFMSCYTTQAIVDFFWKIILGTAHHDQAGMINGLFRKYGHFFGYGFISLVFRNAWYMTARHYAWVTRNWLTLFAGTMAVLSTFAVSGLDELHQHFIPGRVGCLGDALIDTAGALFINVAFWSIRERRRRQSIPA